jgi:8-oxo-dGTP pyrophosphatase MutT (NUDIX family)
MAGTLNTGDGSWTNAYRSYLPRDPRTFTDGAFGPFSPIIPTPVDAPEPDSDFADPRLWQYEVGWNLPTGQPGSEGIKLADFSTLRTLADLYSVARACIQLRKAEIRGLAWDIIPTKEAAKAMRGNDGKMKDFGKRRGEAMKFFRHPDPDYFSWGTFMDALLEEVFVFDALSLLFRMKWGKRQGKGLLGSDLDCLSLINGPTIRPLLGMHGEKPRPPAPAYQQYLYGVPRCDLMTLITGRDLDMGYLSGAEYNRFKADQLLYLPMVPKRWTPYGFPPIERALVPVMSGLQKQGYQLDFFREGTVPAVYISPGGVNSDLTPNQIRELQDALNAVAGDPAWKHKIIVLPAESKVMPQKPTEIADQFDEIVMNQVCMAFDVQPMELGISPKVSTTVSPGASNQMAKASQGTHQRKATKPLLMYLSDIFNRLLWDVCEQDDMQFIFEGLEEDEDEETQTNLIVAQIGAGLASIDEGREALGKQPWGLPETSDPGWATQTGFVPLGQLTASGQVAPGQQPNANAPAGQPPAAGATPGHAAAQATNGKPGAKPVAVPAKPNTAPAKPTGQPVAKPAQPSTTPAKKVAQAFVLKTESRRDTHVAGAADKAARELHGIVTRFHLGHTAASVALQGAVDVMASGYKTVMDSASQHAVEDHGGQVQDFSGLAAQAAQTQREFLMGMLKKAAEAQALSWLTARLGLYGRGLNAAYNSAFGKTVKANHPDYQIIWHLGISEHCKLCVGRDGKSFSFDSLPGYPGDNGFGGADALCLGGPNCFPEGTQVQSADTELGYKRWYDGELVEIVTADGRTLSGTPNHPVLTCAGWKPLGLLQEGDHLICGSFEQSATVDPYVQAVPTGIEKVFNALANVGPAVRHSVLPVDFHGDGAGDGEVQIVGADRELPPYGNATSGKPLRKFVLSGADMGHEAFAGLRHAGGFLLGPAPSAAGGLGGCEHGVSLNFGHGGPAASVGVGDYEAAGNASGLGHGAALFGGHAGVGESLGFADSPDRHAVLPHDGLDEVGGASDVAGERLGALPVDVALDEVLDVHRRPWSGHVYNLQTASGWYVANGILVHNCHCSLEYAEPGQASLYGYNTQLPDSVGYYQSQLDTIMGNRAQAAQQRTDFLDTLPEGAAARALNRDQIRELLADEANATIRATGGYPGVSVEPADIPADLIVAQPDWMKAQNAELEALARHVRKGRLISSWIPRNIDNALLARVAENMAKGLDVDTAIDVARRMRRVDANGQEFWSEGEDTWSGPAGGGGMVLTPHDANDIHHYKGASDPSDPNPVEAEHVYNQLLGNYPPKAIEWVKGARWIGPIEVPLDRVDTDDAKSWAASHQPERVKHFAKKLKKGQPVNPGVSVQEPGESKIKVVDGHHRYLGSGKAGVAFRTYIGFVGSDGGPWDETHTYQFHRGADSQNKGASDLVAAGLIVRAKDSGRVLMLQRAFEDGDPAAGSWEFPGGRLEGDESALNAAEREWSEETGLKVPEGELTASWTSYNGVYRGFVLTIGSESDLPILGERNQVSNPDDPDGDNVEALAWWSPEQLRGNPAVREELHADMNGVLNAVKG